MEGRRWVFRIRLGCLAVALSVAASGCDLFETRQPLVVGDDSGIWIPPTLAEIVVENLERALEAGVFSDYQRAFAGEFEFVPDDSDLASYLQIRPGQAVYAAWDAEVETVTAESIFSSADELDLVFVFREEQLPPGGGRLRKYDYTLTLEVGETVRRYEGQAWFTIRQVGGSDWFITGWEDVITDPDTDSWGFLKGDHRVL